MTATAAALSLVFTAACVACLAYLHLAPTGYSPLRNAVSEYGVGPYARWYRLQAACAGVAAGLLALAIRHDRRIAVLLVVFMLARLAITRFPTDLIGATERTRTGGVHVLLAAAAFVSICWAASKLPRTDGGRPVLGYVATVGLVGTWLALRTGLRPVVGLLERLFYVGMLAWLTVVAVGLA